MSGGGLPTHCTCGAKLLNPHALQPICAECRLIERNDRLAETEAEVQAPQRRRQVVADRLAELDRAAPHSRPDRASREKPADSGNDAGAADG
jgi:hypothetical protein